MKSLTKNKFFAMCCIFDLEPLSLGTKKNPAVNEKRGGLEGQKEIFGHRV